MRLIREKELRSAKKYFAKLANSSDHLPSEKIRQALAGLDMFPKEDVLEELTQGVSSEITLTSFMRLADRCRFQMNLEFRKRAGFAGDAYYELAEIWNRGGPMRTFATLADVIRTFSDSQVQVNTREGRHLLTRRVKRAREAAIDAGASREEVVREGTDDVSFLTFLHLIRAVVRETEQGAIVREREAISLTRFTGAEAIELRKVFSEQAAASEVKNGLSWEQLVARQRGSVGECLAKLARVQSMPETALVLLLKSLGLQLPASRLDEINAYLVQVRSTSEAGEITFATFLRLMRWMLDTNFANICNATQISGMCRPRASPLITEDIA